MKDCYQPDWQSEIMSKELYELNRSLKLPLSVSDQLYSLPNKTLLEKIFKKLQSLFFVKWFAGFFTVLEEQLGS